jgi:UDP-N-acetylglucosamine 4-epimerase
MSILELHEKIRSTSKTWVVTGAAGFIGSNLVEALLQLDQRVVGLDNFSSGHQRNLDQIRDSVTSARWERFAFQRGDIGELSDCLRICRDADMVLHQAALCSVPQSIEDPLTTHASNVTGFVNMLVAARDSGVKRFVYASSSSTYGDHPGLPKVEDVIGKPLSPYAMSKFADELYADLFARCYDFDSIGLRYFNVFGRRQDPEGAYAAVIPLWVAAMIRNEPVFINGDGETSRDFCYIDNVVQANLLAATTTSNEAINQVFNVAVGERITLNALYESIRANVISRLGDIVDASPTYREFRSGDVRHSLADISKARHLLGYRPSHRLEAGLAEAMDWYIRHIDHPAKAQ